jgi:hypothetical protein
LARFFLFFFPSSFLFVDALTGHAVGHL